MSDRPISGFVSLHRAQMSSHLEQCALARSSWHPLGCAAEAMHSLFAHRFVTTLVVIFALAAASSW